MVRGRIRQRVAWLALIAAALLVGAACAGDDDDGGATTPTLAPEVTPTQRPIPPPVTVSPEPQDIGLADPSFEALDGAQAYFGRLGGSVYRIEVPDDWSGTLVLYLHGFRTEPEARAEDAPIRRYLIRNDIAWASSSFSSAFNPGRAADETAALWDEFVRRFGRPAQSYVIGESMGGAATLISAERYANRYDGALAMTPYAGQSAIADYMADFFAVGAYVAGVTQAEFDDRRNDISGLVNERIIPALDDPEAHRRFEDILISITGGPRPFDRTGIAFEEASNWPRASMLVASGLAHNADRAYELAGVSGVTTEAFNAAVIRIAPDPERVPAFIDGSDITGRIEVPTVAQQGTGDFFVPWSHAQKVRRKVDAAGRGDLLAQFGVQSPRHAGYLKSEWERGLGLLRAWVEDGVVPEGEDMLAPDLSAAGEAFTEAPRPGSARGDAVPGAEDRLTISGSVTVDGAPLEGGTLWFMTEQDGLWRACSFEGVRPTRGRYERVIAAESETTGCGGPGATIAALIVRDGKALAVQTIWPEAETVVFDIRFDTGADQPPVAAYTRVQGVALDAAGERLPPGTAVDAYAGDILCGRTAIPSVDMQFDAPDEFTIIVAGPDVRAGCDTNATLRFEVDGAPITDVTLANALDARAYEVVLQAP